MPNGFKMVRLPDELVERIAAAGHKREPFVREAVEAALSVDKGSSGPRPAVARAAATPAASPRPSRARPQRPTNEQIAAVSGHRAGCRCITCYDLSTGRTPLP